MGISGCFPWGQPAVTESHYPTVGACWVFSCFHNPPNSDIDCRIFDVLADVIIIIIAYIYNALNDALSASRIHNKLKTTKKIKQ